jgi:hypothetical protein
MLCLFCSNSSKPNPFLLLSLFTEEKRKKKLIGLEKYCSCLLIIIVYLNNGLMNFYHFFLKKLELAIEELTVIAQDLFDHYRIV